MNTLTSSIIRQKAIIEVVCEEKNVPMSLYGIREDNNGNMYVCSHAGEILRVGEDGTLQVFLTIGGQPNCNIPIVNI